MKNNEIQKSNNDSNQKNEGKKVEKTEQQKNKGFWSAISAIVLLLVAVGLLYLYTENNHKKNYAALQEVNSGLSTELTTRDSLINEWMQAFNEIERDLITIREKENLLKFSSSDPEIAEDIKERILSEIRYLNSLMKENKAKIASLNYKLKQSGMEIAALKEKMVDLENAIAERDNSIADLKTELVKNKFILEDLNMLIDSLDYVVINKNKEIAQQTAKMNTAYVAIGSSKELKQKGLVEKKGGFLGLIGRNKEVSTVISEKDFNAIDIIETNKIKLNSKKAELISDHPVSSYEFVKNDSLVAYLEIKDSKEFWKLTRYVVVETAN
ncbi:MAG: hypothetical protein RBT49_16270 [Bacteroidales bacterium]|nr:hypothetical protein [Bacteroidales bacterium]